MTPLTKSIVLLLLTRAAESTSEDVALAKTELGGLDGIIAMAQENADDVAAAIKEIEALP